MKKAFFILFLIFLTSVNCYSFAGTTSLTTWYPPPSASYKQVTLSTKNSLCTSTFANYCNGSNNGATFLDGSGNLDTCPGTSGGNYCASHAGSLYTDSMGVIQQCQSGTPYCGTTATPANNGTLIGDCTGTLHLCNGGTDSLYPPECFNKFCTYDSSIDTTGATCASYTTGTVGQQGQCPNGFVQTTTSPSAPTNYDQFQTTTNTQIISIVCCST
jgi:hypothetical protein